MCLDFLYNFFSNTFIMLGRIEQRQISKRDKFTISLKRYKSLRAVLIVCVLILLDTRDVSAFSKPQFRRQVNLLSVTWKFRKVNNTVALF